jgi:hypothetical protein
VSPGREGAAVAAEGPKVRGSLLPDAAGKDCA